MKRFIFQLFLGCFLYLNSFGECLAADTTATFTIAAENGVNKCLTSGNSATVKIFIQNFVITPSNVQYLFYAYLNGTKVGQTTSFDITVTGVTDQSKIKIVAVYKGDDKKQFGEQALTFNVTSHPNYVLSADQTSICLDNTGHGAYDVKLSPYLGKNGFTYEFRRGGDNEVVDFTNNDDGTFTRTLNGGQAGTNSYTLFVTQNGCKSNSITSPTFTFKLGAAGLTENVATYTIYMSSPNTINLKELFGTIPGGTTIKFSRVVNNNKYSYIKNESVFDPEGLPEGNYTDSIKYEIINSCGNISGTLKSTITITNDKESLPSFLRSTKELPICKNAESFQLTALIRSECVDRPLVDISIPPFFDIKGWRPTITISDGVISKTLTRDEIEYKGDDVFTNTSQFVFNIEPYKYTGNSVNININTPCETGRVLDDGAIVTVEYNATLKLTPPRVASISGLPAPKGDITYFCSSSADTVSMRGIPSGDPGSYIVEKGVEKDGVYIFEKLGDYKAIRYANYTGTPGDPTLEKFVPSDIFKRLISQNYDSLIRITYWSPKPCSDSVKAIIKFIRPIDVTMSFSKDTICYGDELNLKVNGSKDPSSSFSWSFGDGVSLPFLTDTVVNYTYKNPGRYLLRFQTHINGLSETMCNNDIIDTIYVGANPTASFDVYNNYFGESLRLKTNSKILVANTSEPKDTITNWNWQFDVPVPAVQGKNVSFKSPIVAKEPYKMLHIATTYWGCSDTANVNVPIFPVDTVSVDNFDKEEFIQSSVNGWYHSGQFFNSKVKSSWQNIPPVGNNKKINPITPGNAAWVTFVPDTGGYRAGEKSWVESPVYDIHTLKLPMLSMNTWTNMNSPFDGVSVQFAFCDTTAFGKETWVTLGEKDGEGLNWYNSNSVLGAPGGNNEAWTADTVKAWSLSAYRLDTILKLYDKDPTNRKRVRFRIVLGTTTLGQGMDGFAFDNFFVGQRNRKIIVEEFCDHENRIVKPEDDFIDPQALRIQYHLADLVDDDEINAQNPYEPSARGLLYGIGKALPKVVLDGILYNNDVVYSKKDDKWSQRSLLERSLITSPYTIKIEKSINATEVSIKTTVEKSPTVSEAKNYVVQVAIVEKVVHGNGIDFTNVLRKMLPNSAGHRIDKKSSWNDTSIVASWKPEVKPTSDIYVVAFLQDEDTKEIYQSDYLPVALADYQNLYSGVRPGSPSSRESFNDLTLSPNPTSHDLMVKFDGVLKDDYTWSITDMLGNQRNSGLMLYGTDAIMLNTNQLGTGMYYLKLEGEGRSFIKKFSVVK